MRDALLAEGAAPAGQVFKGMAHLNTVVRVPGVDFPVVVRRRLPEVLHRERSFLSEHAVLRAVEEAGVAVAAPRVLALGRSCPSDGFAIHTYAGPRDLERSPSHPVDGLLPHEADALVDQLCALTLVNYKEVDPVAGEGGSIAGCRRSSRIWWRSCRRSRNSWHGSWDCRTRTVCGRSCPVTG